MIEWKEIKHIIFDLDGVIVNSEGLHYEAYRRAFQKNGLQLSINEYNAKLRSKGRKKGLSHIVGENQSSIIEAIAYDKDDFFGQILEAENIEPYPDALKLIQYCKDNNILIAIGTASNMGRTVLEKMGLTKYFDVIITSQDVKESKPSPEIYLRCLKALNANDNNTMVIEDSESGIIAALGAGLPVINIKREDAPIIKDIYLNNESVLVCNDLEDIVYNLKKKR